VAKSLHHARQTPLRWHMLTGAYVTVCRRYAASDLVQANPLVATFWGLLFFR
jgi:hypothetical protein